MKKILMLTIVAGLMLGSTALAQDSCLFLDIRDNSSPAQLINSPTFPYTVAAQNFGMEGDGQTLYITPHFSDNFETDPSCRNGWPNTDGDSDTHTGCFWLYMDVNVASGGATGTIASIGLDFNVTPPATVKNTIASLSYTWETAVLSPSDWWLFNGMYRPSPQALIGARAVFMPIVLDGWTTAGGLFPTARYRVGKLCVAAGNRNCTYAAGFEANSTYTVNMSVESILITRAFGGPPTDPVEDVAFGYVGRFPESPYAPGNVVGATSAFPDATIIVNLKGDNTNDGRVIANDNAGYAAARAAGTAATQRQVFMNDYNGDRRVLVSDNAGFVATRAHSSICP